MKYLSDFLWFGTIRSRKLRLACRIGILLAIAAAVGIYAYYASHSIRSWNEEQRRIAFEQLKKSAFCPLESLQLTEEQPFIETDNGRERVFGKKALPIGELNQPGSKLTFSCEDRRDFGTVKLEGRKIVLRSDSYLTILNNAVHENDQGVIVKITASGRGRIAPYYYCTGNNEVIVGNNDRVIALRPYRIASWLKKDYYFFLPRELDYDKQRLGIRMRGDLDIDEITFIRGKDKREKETSVGVARILEVSDIPDAEKSPYPDCLFALKVKMLFIETWGDDVPEELILIAPAFLNRKRTAESKWKKGDIIRFSMIRFQKAGETVRRIQQADTLEDFDSERYILTRLVKPKIARLVINPDTWDKIRFRKSKTYISGYDRPQNPPLTGPEQASRQKRIAFQLEKMKHLMETMKMTPSELNREYERVWKKNQKNYAVYNNNYYWTRQGKSCYALCALPFFRNEDVSQMILAIKELSDYMLVHGVSMLVVICPHCYDISARLMNPEVSEMPDYNAANIVKMLLEQGVESLYISDEILKHAHDYDLLFYYPGDCHPAYGTQQTAARTIARYLKAGFPEVCRVQYRPEQFTERRMPYTVTDPIRVVNQKLWDIWFPQGRPFYQQVLLNGKPIGSDPSSPIMLYGNSYLYTPEDLPGLYLASALTRELKRGIDVMFRPGYHPLMSMLLDLLERPEQYLKGRKVCVFYYGVPFFRAAKIWNIRELDQIKRRNSAAR